jgi:RHS repeat-associated protein
VIAAAAGVVLAAALAACSPGISQAPGSAPAAAPAGTPVKVLTPHKPVITRPANHAAPPFKATATRWPAPASGSVMLGSPPPGQPAGPVSKVAGTPLWLQPVTAGPRTASEHAATGASQVTATVLPRATAAALGIPGVVFQVGGAPPAGAKVRVGLDYASFAQAYGGNYGTRLQLVSLPACALTTPQVPACRRQTALGSAQDYRASTVSAVVPLPAAPAASAMLYSSASSGTGQAASAGVLLAATSSTGQEGGAAGEYPPTPLAPSGTWSEGGDSGAFTYSYPITLPSASAKLVPSLSLSYDSQAVDGKTATTQAQSSWVGDGWQTPDSFISLQTTSCADSPEGTASPSATSDECYAGKIVQMSLDGAATPLVFTSSTTSGGVTTSKWRAQSDDGELITHVAKASTVLGKYDSTSPGSDYWTVTERNGTAYTFGMQHLPGWASGKQATNSVDTMPVYSAHSGDPCYDASGFAASVCPMVYEWHLDYVTDTHSEAMAYFYTQFTNYYGEDNGASNVPYVADSYLDHIAYGFPSANAYGTVPDIVTFNAQPRCVAATCGAISTSNPNVATQYPDIPVDLACASGATCTSHAPALFSEVRLDSITTQQYNVAAGAYQDVDAYQFTQKEPGSGDGLAATLWLDSIARTGNDTTAGGSSAVTLPPVSFGKIDLPNRVFTATYPGLYRYRIASVTSQTGSVTNVSYGTPYACSSSYSSSSPPSVTSANTDSCYPVFWTPPANSTPVLDWFESYAVTQVLTADQSGGSLTQESDYSYDGGAAWHYDDNEVVQKKYRTWGQFRGYGTVTTRTGQLAANPQTQQATAYYRGMNGDTLPSGTRSVTLTDSQGGNHADANQLAGSPLEATTYLGSGGPVASSAITSYWVSAATATLTRDGLPDLTANMTATAETWTRTALTDGGQTGVWNVTETDNTYDATTSDANFGLLTFSYSHTSPVNTAYDSCTRYQYAPANTSENLVGLVSYTETDKVACAGYTAGVPASVPSGLNTLTAPASVAATKMAGATQTFYDDTGFSTTFPQAGAPTAGNVTMTRKASAWSGTAFTWQTTARATYDSYGRVLNAYDALGNQAVTSYTVNSAGLTTAVQVAAPPTTYVNSSGTTITTTHVSSQTLAPSRALVLTATDQNGVTATEQYDALGRLTSVWKDGRATTSTANITYAYTVTNVANDPTKVSGIVTQTLNEESNYVPSVTIYDSLGRVRQTQTLGTTPSGDGRLVTDTLYDSRGWTAQVTHAYYDSSSLPALSLFTVPANQAHNVDQYTYDGAGRQVEDTSVDTNTAVSTTVTVYNGDATTVIPGIPATPASGAIPATAGVVQTTAVNPVGQTTSLTEYTANPTLTIPANVSTGTFSVSGGTASATTYAYDAMGNQVSQTLGGKSWTQQYNLLGQETQSADPSGGTTTMTDDADGNLLQTHDALGNNVSWTYDQDNRKTAQYAAATGSQVPYTSTASPGNQTASWVYDNANAVVPNMADPKGPATTVTSYANGLAYKTQQIGFNAFGESAGEVVSLPTGAPGAGLGANFVIQNTYQPINGGLFKTAYPAAGGLPMETVTYTTTSALDLLSIVGGLGDYAHSTSYSAWGQPTAVQLGGGTTSATVTDTYDQHTGNLTDQLVQRSTAPPPTVDETSYAYSPAGALTRETDKQLGSATTSETQCFAYTTQGQLSQAWTATDNCAATPTPASHATVGDGVSTAAAYDETWTFNSLGQPATKTAYVASAGSFANTTYGYSTTQPTALTSAATTGAVTSSFTFAYNADGQQQSRSTSVGNQTLAWNNSGNLAGVTATSGGAPVASYVYGSDGSLFTQTEGARTTVYLPGEQMTIDTSTSPATLSGVRFYSLPGGITAVRTGLGSNYGFELQSDNHGTSTLWLDSTAQVPAWRQFDPYGAPRGTAPGAGFPGSRGFLGKVADAGTGLTDVGARWYDPVTGSFASLDPVLDAGSQAQLNGYAYAGGNPVGSSDPTGLRPTDCTGGGCEGNVDGGNPWHGGSSSHSGGGGGLHLPGDSFAGGTNGGSTHPKVSPPNDCPEGVVFICWGMNAARTDANYHGAGNGFNWNMEGPGACASSALMFISTCGISLATSGNGEGDSQGGSGGDGPPGDTNPADAGIPNLAKLINDIAEGLRRASAAAAKFLYPGGRTGALYMEGWDGPISLSSGDKNLSPSYRENIPPGTNKVNYHHLEAQAAGAIRAQAMRTGGPVDAVLFITGKDGACTACDPNLPTMLPEGSTLRVVWQGADGEPDSTLYTGVANPLHS